MLGHVFDHQTPLRRSLEAVGAACSTTTVRKHCQKPMEINENQWKSMKNQWKSMKILDLEVEQAATTASHGRVSTA